MTRVFFNTQPGVLSLVSLEPETYVFGGRGYLHGRDFVLSRQGKGWVLYRPCILEVSHADLSPPYRPAMLSTAP